MCFLTLPLLIVISLMCGSGFSTNSAWNSLNGQHLRIIWPRWHGQPKGLSGPLKGGVALEYLSTRLNFTYEMIRVTENRLEPPLNGRGLFNYLWEQQCDFLIQDVVPTFQRNRVVDLTSYWIYDHFTFLIPVSDETANLNAVVKPFQWPVWLGLGISIVCVIAILNVIQRYLKYRSRFETNLTGNEQKDENTTQRNIYDTKKDIGNQYLYVLGNLLSQGHPYKSKLLPVRFVAGVWILAAFIFVQAYTSTLFTYVVKPVNQPLISTVHDVVDNVDIKLFIKIGGTPDNILSDTNKTGLYMKLREKLNSNPKSRCILAPDCISAITPGSRNVFLDANIYHKDAIREDFQKTRKCNLQIAKAIFMPMYGTFALPKNSPYTKSINQGLLELQQIGLINFWDLWFRPMPPQCMENIQNGKKTTDNKHKPLSLKNLTGAFLVIAIGLSLSFLALLGEKIVSISKGHINCTQTKLTNM